MPFHWEQDKKQVLVDCGKQDVGLIFGNHLQWELTTTAEFPRQSKLGKHLTEWVWVWLVLPPGRMTVCLASGELSKAFPYDSANIIITSFMLPYQCACALNWKGNTKAYGLSPWSPRSVLGHITQSASRKAGQYNLHLNVFGSCLFTKELRWTNVQYGKRLLKKAWNKPEGKGITSKKWLMMQPESVKGHLDFTGVQSTVWPNTSPRRSWKRDLPRTFLGTCF